VLDALDWLAIDAFSVRDHRDDGTHQSVTGEKQRGSLGKACWEWSGESRRKGLELLGGIVHGSASMQ